MNTIKAQKGVEIFYGENDFPKKNYFHHKSWTEIVRKFPRDLYIDANQNAIYANYSATYGNSCLLKTPNILRIDLKTKQTKYFVNFYSYDIDAHAETVIATVWFENRIYELSKDDLSVVRKFPEKIGITPAAILNIYHDNLKDFIYLLNDMKPALLKYNRKTGKLVKILQPEDFKQGLMWNFQLSNKTGMIYLIIAGEGKAGILEIEPETLKISRRLFFDTIIATALKLDDENGLLYFQDGHSDKLYEIDVKSLKIQRVIKGEVHSRGIHIDKGRNCLYLLSYFYGRLIALDLESGKRLWTVKVGGKPYGMAVHNDAIYVNSRAGIVKVDLEAVE